MSHKIQLIEQAIEKAIRHESKLTPQALAIPFLGSIKIRHLMNNLGAISSRYLECGCHKGGSFCSTIFGNHNIEWGYGVDNYMSDKTEGETAEWQFLNNALYFRPPRMELRLVRHDIFSADTKMWATPFDLYLYDGSHDEESQYKALPYYLHTMADEFIFVVDDYDWDEVKNGTQRGIKDSGVKVLFEKHLPSAKTREQGGHDNESFWNGFYVALLKK